MHAMMRCARAVEASRAGLVARAAVPFHHRQLLDGNVNFTEKTASTLLNQTQLINNNGFCRASHGHHHPHHHAGASHSPSAVASAGATVVSVYAPHSNAAAALFHTSSASGVDHSNYSSNASSSSSSSSASPSSYPPEKKSKNTVNDYMLFHPQYEMDKIADIKPSHRPPTGIRDWASYGAVQFARSSFDRITGYAPDKVMTREEWLTRFVFLETVAGVPGMVAAMLRHMVSLRTLKRDHGWIHTLLEEAENERMHLLTFMQLKNPGIAFRLAVLGAQGVFFNAFLAAYILTPRTCHRFVGYLEEEAVKTYTHALHDIDVKDSDASVWASSPAPEIAVQYWRLASDATVRDVILAVRADEASHSHVNHTLGSMAKDQDNPFHTGHSELPANFVDPPEGFKPHYDAPRTPESGSHAVQNKA